MTGNGRERAGTGGNDRERAGTGGNERESPGTGGNGRERRVVRVTKDRRINIK